jgi:hypothetical protein
MSETVEMVRRMVFDLLRLPSRLLIVVGIAGFLAVCGLMVLAHLDAAISSSGIAATMLVVVLVFSTFALVLGIGRPIGERFRRTMDFTAFGHECWAHVVTQRDGRTTTQIVCDLHVSNRTDNTRLLTDFQLLRPRTRAHLYDHSIFVQQQNGRYYGRYPIPPRGRIDARGHLIVDPDLDREITRRGITVEIAEQDGHRHRLKFPDARIHSRGVVPSATAPVPSTASFAAK